MSKYLSDFTSKPSGYIFIDGKEAGCTMQCPHCNAHFLYRKGSGRLRGFCPKCMKITCGKERCTVCIPFQAKLDFIDGGNGLKTKKYDNDIIFYVRKHKSLI